MPLAILEEQKAGEQKLFDNKIPAATALPLVEMHLTEKGPLIQITEEKKREFSHVSLLASANGNSSA